MQADLASQMGQMHRGTKRSARSSAKLLLCKKRSYILSTKWLDHLISRATVAFKAKLLRPKDDEVDKVYCFKSRWPNKIRRYEGSYLEFLQGTPGVVSLLAYDVPHVELVVAIP